MSETILKVDNISKKFCRDLKASMLYGLHDLILGHFKNGSEPHLRNKEFWAVHNVSFELKRGETLGLLGTNGSGKSTLLRLIAGLFPPDSGKIEITGKVASLIAVGAGFHPHMTGRENIFLNGAILGLSKEFIRKNFDSIVDFAEIHDFLDAPVSTYSSGMRVRLGFAIATISNPDLLLLDEILAVGDAKFRIKCYERISKISDSAAIIFVSHSMEQVSRICDLGLLLHKSKEIQFGPIPQVLQKYLALNEYNETNFLHFNEDFINSANFELESKKISYGDSITIRVSIKANKEIRGIWRIVIYNNEEKICAEWNSLFQGAQADLQVGLNEFKVQLDALNFQPGKYSFNVVYNNSCMIEEIIRSFKELQFEIEGSFIGVSDIQLKGRIRNER